MKYRKLRIAWSVAWGVACLLLIALWARSYSFEDFVAKSRIELCSNRGTVMFIVRSTFSHPALFRRSAPLHNEILGPRNFAYWQGKDFNNQDYTCLNLPHWFSILTLSAIAYVPWLRWQFSLRALLIATTLVAVALGSIVYVTRK
jgi:hypothetical protein